MIYILQHAPHESPGMILDWLDKSAKPFSLINLYAGEPLPGIGPKDGLIIMGGSMNVYEDERYPWLLAEKDLIAKAIDEGAHVLGICLGSQLIAAAMGAGVKRNPAMEVGWFPVRIDQHILSGEFKNVFSERFSSFHWHGDTFEIPRGCQSFASSEATRSQGFFYDEQVIGIQFHPEMTHEGMEELIHVDGADLLSESIFVQTADEMRKGAFNFPENKVILFHLLDALFRIP